MSLPILDFFIFFIWINFIGFIISYFNLLNLFILCEIFWVIFFVYLSLLSSMYNSMILFLISIYILCLATSETTIGLSILILKFSIYGSISSRNLIFINLTDDFNKLKAGLINSNLKNLWEI